MVGDAAHERLTGIDGVGETVAKALLDRYGSVDAVLEANESDLRTVTGVGETTAQNIVSPHRRESSGSPSTAESARTAERELTRIDGVGEAVAERLVERFGTARAVVQAKKGTLEQVSGVGPAVAGRLASATWNGDGKIVPRKPSSSKDRLATSGSQQTDTEGFTVRNVVLSGDLDLELVLEAVEMDMRAATLEEGEKGGKRLVYDPLAEGTVRVTESGKLLVAGVASEEAADNLLESFLDDLPPVGIDEETVDLAVKNVVATATVDNPVPLSGLAVELEGEDAEYDPSGFPGYSFTLPTADCTFTLFGSGKVTITGSESVAEARAALETLNETLDEFDPEALREPNDSTHDRVDAVAAALDIPATAIATAHELVDEYDAALPGSSRGDDAKAGAALYLATDSPTQSKIADAAGVSPVTIRNVLQEFREF